MGSGMRSHNVGNVSGGAYPFGGELEKLDIKEGEVAIVDVAGGQDHILEESTYTSHIISSVHLSSFEISG